ncbi:MAG TPA: DUF202 domain-containing protein [Nostocaceae cyanobacterium]|nr:DUF202 domain-containing protein [Nostocaceae cyanobacterium]
MQPQTKEIKRKRPVRENPARVRDHLANERTYLAWMRTAIALLGFGVVIVRLRIFPTHRTSQFGNAWQLGLIFALVGLITVCLSTIHYFAVQREIEEDTYELTNRWVILFSLAVMILAAGVVYFVFTTPFNALNPVMIE